MKHLREPFYDILRFAMVDSDYAKRCRALDTVKTRGTGDGKHYYQRPTELTARMFESFVDRRTMELGEPRPDLCWIPTEVEWGHDCDVTAPLDGKRGREPHASMSTYPYPRDNEVDQYSSAIGDAISDSGLRELARTRGAERNVAARPAGRVARAIGDAW